VLKGRAGVATKGAMRLAAPMALVCSAAALALPAPAGAAAGAPERLFARDAFWNQPVATGAPLDRHSVTLVRELNREVRAVLRERRGPWIGTREATTPIHVVDAGHATVRVALEDPGLWWRTTLQDAFAAVPIPPDARPAPGADGHLVVWQPSTDRMWEFFGLSRTATGWRARWGGAMQRVSRSPGYYTNSAWPGATAGWAWGATATSLPVAGGVMRLAELQRGRIDHALALNIPRVRATAHAWPAQRSDGRSTDPSSIPQGARFRLDPALDLDRLRLPPVVRVIARAAQRYGMVVRDTSSTVALYAEMPTSTTDPYPRLFGPAYPNNLHELLARFPWRHLQLLRMRLCPRSPAGPCERANASRGDAVTR
jgi:hypothetical protein